jgi:hypothetical protein
MKRSILIFWVMGFLSLHTHAQKISTLTGQYGCLLNRNFGGYDLALIQSTDDGSITGSNFLIYFDFNSKTSELNVVGSKTWGVTKIIPGELTVTNGTLSVGKGPLTHSFLVTTTIATPKGNYSIAFNLLPVNGGATLLVQSATSGTGYGGPTTGVCNKV